MSYLWVMIGSAIGGLLRYTITRWTLAVDTGTGFPYGTLAINIIGSFVIGYFGTLTLQSTRFAVSPNARLFVMVGICGGFTTFSSFSLQTFDLMRTGLWGKALANVIVSIVLCIAAVGAGHMLAHRTVARFAIAETAEEEYTG